MSALPVPAGGSEPPSPVRERATAAALALAAAGLVGAVAVNQPAATLPFDLGPFLAFDPGKVPAFLRSLLVLAAIDLAAWGAGGPAQRLLGAPAPWPVVDVLRRLGLGFLVLADVVLLLAALRLARPGLLAAVLAGLAAAGAAAIVRRWRGSRFWPAAPGGREPAALLAGAAVAFMVAGAVLGAHMPDYGWDAFTYHLALPERYLFENRVVVSPLFPHSAMPLTVEMLYAIVLALDPGPAAKLLHAQLGVLVLAAAAAMAARHSRRAAALAVLVLAADPLFNWELGVAYSDLGAALFGLLALASLQQRLSAGEEARGGAALRLAGVFAGACVATRYTAAAVPLAVLAALWLARGPWRRSLRDSVTVSALCGLVLSPWLLRNLILTGNPAAPALQWVFYEPGQEYFDARALEQQVAFVRRVGFGRGPVELLALPVNLTVRARPSDYGAFGFRIGALYVAGVAAALAFPRARRSAAARALLPAAGLMALAWFLTSQEPRYLLPALGLAAVAAGAGLDELMRSCARMGPAGAGRLAWVIPAAALLHTQAANAVRLPWLYGYALGRSSVQGFRGQEPALMVADRLRETLGPRDRLLLVYEPRGFFFRGLDYVFAHYFELMQLVHRAGDPESLAAELRALGVTHVLVNTGNVARYGTVPVPGYGERELEGDLRVLGAMLERHSSPMLADRGVFVRRLHGAPAAPAQ